MMNENQMLNAAQSSISTARAQYVSGVIDDDGFREVLSNIT